LDDDLSRALQLDESPLPLWAMVLIVCGGAMLLIFIALRLTDPRSSAMHAAIFIFSIVDLIADMWFVYVMEDVEQRSVFEIIAIVFTVVPFLFNAVVIAWMIRKEWKKDGMVDQTTGVISHAGRPQPASHDPSLPPPSAAASLRVWMRSHWVLFLFVYFVSCSNLDSIFLLISNIWRFEGFRCPWSAETQSFFTIVGLANIVFEDGPQAILQIVIMSDGTFRVVNLMSMASSLITAIFKLGKRAAIVYVAWVEAGRAMARKEKGAHVHNVSQDDARAITAACALSPPCRCKLRQSDQAVERNDGESEPSSGAIWRCTCNLQQQQVPHQRQHQPQHQHQRRESDGIEAHDTVMKSPVDVSTSKHGDQQSSTHNTISAVNVIEMQLMESEERDRYVNQSTTLDAATAATATATASASDATSDRPPLSTSASASRSVSSSPTHPMTNYQPSSTQTTISAPNCIDNDDINHHNASVGQDAEQHPQHHHHHQVEPESVHLHDDDDDDDDYARHFDHHEDAQQQRHVCESDPTIRLVHVRSCSSAEMDGKVEDVMVLMERDQQRRIHEQRHHVMHDSQQDEVEYNERSKSSINGKQRHQHRYATINCPCLGNFRTLSSDHDAAGANSNHSPRSSLSPSPSPSPSALRVVTVTHVVPPMEPESPPCTLCLSMGRRV